MCKSTPAFRSSSASVNKRSADSLAEEKTDIDVEMFETESKENKGEFHFPFSFAEFSPPAKRSRIQCMLFEHVLILVQTCAKSLQRASLQRAWSRRPELHLEMFLLTPALVKHWSIFTKARQICLSCVWDACLRCFISVLIASCATISLCVGGGHFHAGHY